MHQTSGIEIPTCDPCPFCACVTGTNPCAFVTRSDQVACVVNVRQYERGAMLVVPIEHRATVFDLDQRLLAAVYAEAVRVGAAAVRAFGATGLNIYQNNGVPAGQSIPHHHVHVVPRYPGSDAGRRFREAEFAPVSLDEQLEVARWIRASL